MKCDKPSYSSNNGSVENSFLKDFKGVSLRLITL